MIARRPLIETWLAATVVAGMVTCIAVAGVAIGEQARPAWNGTYLVLACGLVAIEAFCTYHLYRARHLYISGGTKYRAAELFALLVLFEILTDLVNGQPLMEGGFPRIDEVGLLLFVPVFLAWRVSTDTASDINTVQREIANVAPSESRARSDDIKAPLEMVVPVVRNMLLRFFVGGVAIFLLAGVSQTRNASALHMERPGMAGPLINVLLYFALGIGMMALLRYGTLLVEWSAGKRIVAVDLPVRWLRYGLFFLAGLAIFAALLPTSYGTDLLGTAQSSLHGVLASLGTQFAHLMQFFNLRPEYTHRVIPNPPKKPPPGLGHGHRPPTKPQHTDLTPFLIIRALIFWLAVVALAVYVFRSVRKERTGRTISGPSRLARLVGWLEIVWQALRGRVRRVAALARPRERRRSPVAEVVAATAPRPRLRFGSMSSRERIVYYFASIAQRLEREGRRAPSQTALELEAQIGPTLAEAAPDMRALTQAYLEARYSAHPVGETEERAAKGSWERLKDALRGDRGKSSKTG